MHPLAPAVDYSFMLPACVVIAMTAVFAGISGATLLLPLFFLGFPRLGVPALSVDQAVGAALALQISAFGLAVVRYAARRLVSWSLVRRISSLSVPAAVVGAMWAPHLPVAGFRLLFAAGLLVVAPLLWRRVTGRPAQAGAKPLGRGDLVLAGGIGGAITGIVSAGIGEATVPILVRRRVPLATCAATATVLVAFTVGAATVTTATRLAIGGKFSDVAWPVMAWGLPGAVAGAETACRIQGRLPEQPVRRFLAALFVLIAVAFTVLALR